MVENVIKRRNCVLSLSEVVTKLELDVPDNFEKVVKENMRTGDIMRITERDAEELQKILEFWKPIFVDKNSYAKLAVECMLSLTRNHCAVVSTNEGLESYVGKYGGVNLDASVFKNNYTITTAFSLGSEAFFPGCPVEKYHF